MLVIIKCLNSTRLTHLLYTTHLNCFSWLPIQMASISNWKSTVSFNIYDTEVNGCVDNEAFDFDTPNHQWGRVRAFKVCAFWSACVFSFVLIQNDLSLFAFILTFTYTNTHTHTFQLISVVHTHLHSRSTKPRLMLPSEELSHSKWEVSNIYSACRASECAQIAPA